MKSFYEFVAARQPEVVPDAMKLAVLIAQSSATGICHRDLRQAVDLEPDTLESLLTAMIAVGQITVAEIGGQRVYRVMGY